MKVTFDASFAKFWALGQRLLDVLSISVKKPLVKGVDYEIVWWFDHLLLTDDLLEQFFGVIWRYLLFRSGRERREEGYRNFGRQRQGFTFITDFLPLGLVSVADAGIAVVCLSNRPRVKPILIGF